MKERLKDKNGITLIALVITIIILIILAGVAINLTIGENGIFKKMTSEGEKYEISHTLEMLELQRENLILEKQGKNDTSKETVDEYINFLASNGVIEYGDTTTAPYIEEENHSAGRYIVINEYIYTITQEENGIKISASGQKAKDKLPLVSLKVLNSSTSSITIDYRVGFTKLKKAEYYIGQDGDYRKVGEDTTGKKTYTFEGLKANEVYNIKLHIVGENGKENDATTMGTTIEMRSAESLIKFEETPVAWNSTTHTASIKVWDDEGTDVIQYVKNLSTSEELLDDSNWITLTQKDNENKYAVNDLLDDDVVYFRLWDGTNASTDFRTVNVEDGINPTVGLNITYTTTSIEATANGIDNESGLRNTYNWKVNNVAQSETGNVLRLTNLPSGENYVIEVTVTDIAGNTARAEETVKTSDVNISINANSGTYSGINPIVSNGRTEVTLETPTRTGYTFTGWTADKGTIDGNKYTFAGENATVTANWKVITYNITYNLNGGNNNANNPSTYTVEDSITIQDPTRTGYSFINWTGDGTTIAKGSTGDKTYTANWKDVVAPTVTAYAGAMLYTDPTFSSGVNSTTVYNNLGNGNVKNEKVSMSTPEGSTALKITTNGAANPYHGGFYFATPSSVTKRYITRIVAKIPVGYTLGWYSNATGNNRTQYWLTSTEGTGNWQEYMCVVDCGNSGTFSSTNFFAISGGTSPVTWYVAYATVFDATAFASGTLLYTDPSFSSGVNSTHVYNNSANGTVTNTRVSLSTPVGSYALRVKTNGTASPGHGGYYYANQSSANKVFVSRIIAKIPVGYNIQWGSNAIGTGGTNWWITSQNGIGDWKEYVHVTKCGSSGTFSTTSFYYLSDGSNTVTWDVAYSGLYNITGTRYKNYIVFSGVDNESGIVAYGINQSSTTQPTWTTVTNNKNICKAYGKVTSNGTYYVWVKDKDGNVSNTPVSMLLNY